MLSYASGVGSRQLLRETIGEHLHRTVEAFLMTVTGKVQKYLMREASVDELGLLAAAGVTTA